MKKESVLIKWRNCKHSSSVLPKRDERDPDVVWCNFYNMGKVANSKIFCDGYK